MKGASNHPGSLEPVPAHEVSWGQAGPPHLEPTGVLSAEARLERCLEEMVRFYRHSAVGRRCHGIIHNLHAPLQVISFQLDLLEQKGDEEWACLTQEPPPGPDKWPAFLQHRRERLRQIKRELEHLQAITSRLIYQGIHEDRQDRLYLDLNRLYQEELTLYQDDLFFKHQVKKEIQLKAHFPPIYGHYIDFSQSFRNLVDNALEAMEGVERRRLIIETEFQDNRRIVRIGDTGGGIPPEIRSRLFEPFVTTKGKPQEPRAGLGLFLAARLLSPYGGQIFVESQPGETWMTMAIPTGSGG